MLSFVENGGYALAAYDVTASCFATGGPGACASSGSRGSIG